MKRFLSVLPLFLAVILCIGCRAKSSFDGSIISNDDIFRIDYTFLNRREDAFLSLSEGDTLKVSYVIVGGSIEICIGIDEDEPIYTGNALCGRDFDMNFTINIQKSGTYRITVIGHDASGVVSFIKNSSAQNNTTHE